MALQLPTEKLDASVMFRKVDELSRLGEMKIQEAHATITTNMMQKMFLAGYRQAMRDHGIPIDGETQE